MDDFPTPPWATRALLEHIIFNKAKLREQSCLEPACGSGHMAKVLTEYFGMVRASDIHNYGYGAVTDFLVAPKLLGADQDSVDWIITNPPFRLAEDFLEIALKRATVGVALLTRTVFIESVGRYERIFKKNPPTWFAQFTERVPMVKGRLDKKASTATGYAWLVWDKSLKKKAQLTWVPPCRKVLERESDYDPAPPLTPKQRKPTVQKKKSNSQPDLFAA